MTATSDEMSPLPLQYEELVRRELAQDLGTAGDLTSAAVVPAASEASGRLVARAHGRVCGLAPALFAFEVTGAVVARVERGDGSDVRPGEALAVVGGSARSILAAERTALNLLGHLSGVATAARDLARLIEPYPARLVCTRKTTPGLRVLEKYAVRCGGARNHRFGLYDAVLIKDNHRAVVGGVSAAIEAVRAALGHMVRLEVEVDTLNQLAEALDAGVDTVLLDNMSIDELRKAVAMARGRALTEASGGVTAETIVDIAATRVDLISVGWITHSAPALDVGLDFEVSSRKR